MECVGEGALFEACGAASVQDREERERERGAGTKRRAESRGWRGGRARIWEQLELCQEFRLPLKDNKTYLRLSKFESNGAPGRDLGWGRFTPAAGVMRKEEREGARKAGGLGGARQDRRCAGRWSGGPGPSRQTWPMWRRREERWK